jgi:hypothetical protein
MHYMLLIYGDPTADARVGGPAPADAFVDWPLATDAMRDDGVLLAGDGLHTADAATTVRFRGGEELLTDGPFAETKEQLLGYYLIDVDDLDRALAWARRMPNVHWGSVEVRPVNLSAASPPLTREAG